MKTLLTYVALLLSLSAMVVPAATFQWSADGFAMINQIVADGKGGCAVLGTNGGGFYIVWLDKKGVKIYEKTVVNTCAGILSCDNKTLVYNMLGSPYTLIAVDKKGVETTVSDPAYNMRGVFMTTPNQPNVPRDSKGFFTAQAPTGPGTWRVARYTFK